MTRLYINGSQVFGAGRRAYQPSSLSQLLFDSNCGGNECGFADFVVYGKELSGQQVKELHDRASKLVERRPPSGEMVPLFHLLANSV